MLLQQTKRPSTRLWVALQVAQQIMLFAVGFVLIEMCWNDGPIPPAIAQADVWQRKIKEYVDQNYILIDIAKTPDVTVVYLCKPNGNAWWAYKLMAPGIRTASLSLQGTSAYNSYKAGGQGHGQGVFFGYDPGPLTERAPVPNEQFRPLGQASISISARTDDGVEANFNIGRLSQAIITQLARCLGHSFPRVLHEQVLIGRNRPR